VPQLNVRDLGDFIRDQRRTAQISLRQLAAQAGVSNPYLSQIERGLRKPSAEILQQIAKALRISAEVLYVQAGILDERVSDSEVSAAVLAETTLTERQKQVLLEIYEAFRRENAAGEAPGSTGAAAAAEGPLDEPSPAADETEPPPVTRKRPTARRASTAGRTRATKAAATGADAGSTTSRRVRSTAGKSGSAAASSSVGSTSAASSADAAPTGSGRRSAGGPTRRAGSTRSGTSRARASRATARPAEGGPSDSGPSDNGLSDGGASGPSATPVPDQIAGTPDGAASAGPAAASSDLNTNPNAPETS
jgi:transcriptional regulator with XRE-family HTH domain